MHPDAYDILDAPQLFLHDDLIADAVGLRRCIHQMRKVADSPVVPLTAPWEGKQMSPIGVAYDRQAGEWHMWYTTHGAREPKLPGAAIETLHLATSPDGLHWTKPALGAYAAAEAPGNNLCVFDDGTPVPGGCVVFDEPDNADPSQRYKLIYYPGFNYYLAYSADGIHWRKYADAPVWTNGDGDGLEETYFFMRDEQVGKYRGYMRVWQRHQSIRKTSLGESDDLRAWTGPHIIWEGEPTYGLGAQLYGMNVFCDGGLYWALPWMFYTDQPLDPALQQTMRFKLAWSEDGIAWHALAPEQDALPLGSSGSYETGMHLSCCPAVLLEDRIRLYYLGADHRHNIVGGTAQIGLAEIRRHGFVSLRADEEGQCITRRLLFRGEALRINAHTESDGYIIAEILNDRGELVAGRTYETSDPFTGDAVDHRLTWSGNGSLRDLFGGNIMLRLKLHKAEIFSFRADGPPERFTEPLGPSPVRCGRCTHTPVIDGILNDNAWQDFTNSGVADDFVRFDRIEPAAIKARVMLTYDDANLYISAECEEPLSDRLRLESESEQIDYQRDEVLEFRFSAPGQGTHFNQFMVTPAGGKFQAWFSVEEGGVRVVDEMDWQAKTSTVPGRWYLEMAIPFTALNTQVPAPGEQWQMNIIRYRKVEGTDDRSCWSCMFGSVHRNDRSGLLVFV